MRIDEIGKALRAVEACLADSIPDIFTEEFTVESVGYSKHGIIFPPRALSKILHWSADNPNDARSLAEELIRSQEE